MYRRRRDQIEVLRSRLYHLADIHRGNLCHPDIIACSQELDRIMMSEVKGLDPGNSARRVSFTPNNEGLFR
ncbi:MAG: aspartyl-phosphate phosphatase Spo0E family protein [Alicyclobacillus sp.]|nr:aspartyl-phosphate phosphatase Spo0E family protein [Alicyclobacillus sp.]